MKKSIMTKRATRRRLSLATVAMVIVAAGCAGPPRDACDMAATPGTLCGFENPEDIELLARSGVVLVSNLRLGDPLPGGGFLSAMTTAGATGNDQQTRPWKVWPREDGSAPAADNNSAILGSPDCPGPPDPAAFNPHGISSTSSGELALLYVVAHVVEGSGREAVEIFAVVGSGLDTKLSWLGCIPTPDAIQANDLAVSADGTVYASNYQPDNSPMHAIKASLLGTDSGSIIAWKPGAGWSEIEGTSSKLANGVALSKDGKVLYYTETISRSLHRKPLDGSPSVWVDIPGMPDNLSWTERGTLLVASHTSGPRFMACASGRLPCRSPWIIHELDPATMALRPVFEHAGDRLGAVATATAVNDKILLATVFDDRIGVISD